MARVYLIGVCMTPSRTELGRFIRERRINLLGYSQNHLAKLAGITNLRLSTIEIGRCERPDDDLLRRLAPILRCSVHKLRSMVPPPHPPLQVNPRHAAGRFIWEHCIGRGWSPSDIAERLGIPALKMRELVRHCGPTITLKTARWLTSALAIEPEALLPFIAAGRIPPRNPLGELIERTRRLRGLERSDLAARLGVRTQYIQQLVLGRLSLVTPRSERLLRRLARILDLPFADLQPQKPIRRIKRVVTSDPIGMFLAERRSAQGLSRPRVARKAGMSEFRYRTLELGKAQPTPEELGRLIEVLCARPPVD